jgi:hypothetical protein
MSLEQLVFENPWPIVIVFVLVGGVLVWHGKRSERNKLVRVGQIVIAFGVGAWALAETTMTDRELVYASSRVLIRATTPFDSEQLRNMLDRKAVLVGPSGKVWRDRDGILLAAKAANSKHVLTGHKVRRMDIQIGGDARFESVPSKWRIKWRPPLPTDTAGANGKLFAPFWRMTEIQIIEIATLTPRQDMIP